MQKKEVSIQKGQFENVLAVAFAPVVALSELIKNSSDACMTPKDNIKIYIDVLGKKIRLIDNGYGFSLSDIDNLCYIGSSAKMKDGNNLSRIGEPFAGSKGLGILTAFNLCNTLEINTYSQIDKKAYKVLWVKGDAQFSVTEIENTTQGTELILHEVSDEAITLVTMNEELTKLYLSSITYYIDNSTLPSIELYEGSELKNLTPKNKIEDLYHKFKKVRSSTAGYFVAKATFKYSNNILTLSYEDNAENIYNFKDAEINLSDFASVSGFLKKNKIFNANFRDTVDNFDEMTKVDDFEGVYYIWRNTKHKDIDYPYGVRIYINNYGLYNYLNQDYDWLRHSDISQNVRATNYKLKNTFGYVNFSNYIEGASQLKISNERNDFYENLAKKKFYYIMQKFVSGIFSSVDISMKNFDTTETIVFKKRVNHKSKVIAGNCFIFSDFISTNLSFDDIVVDVPSEVNKDDNGFFLFTKEGNFTLRFGYNDEIIDVDVLVESDAPYFELQKISFSVAENNTEDLRRHIKRTSLKNIILNDIKIESDKAKISGGYLLNATNLPGKYNITYKYSEELKYTAQLTVVPFRSQQSNRLRELFPCSCMKYPKITDIIYSISDNHGRNPELCMIAIRPLIEFALKAFIEEFYSDEERAKMKKEDSFNNSFNVPGKLDGFFARLQSNQFANVNSTVLDKYRDALIDVKKQITKGFDSLDLNNHIHNPNAHAIPKDVSQFLRKLQLFLNFVIEAINSK